MPQEGEDINKTFAFAREDLYATYYPHLMKRARYELRDRPGDLDDVVSETMLELLEHPHKFRGAGSALAYAKSVLGSKIQRLRRGRGNPDSGTKGKGRIFCMAQMPRPGEDEEGNVEEFDWAGDSPPPSEAMLKAEQAGLLKAAIKQLPSAQAEALYLFYWDGLSCSAIASRLSTNENTVKTRLRRARNTLCTMLGPSFNDGLQGND